MELSENEFASLVQEALGDIPEPFAEHLRHVVVEVVAHPDAQTLEDMGIDDPTELLGIYHGTPLTERGFDDGLRLPDRITIFQHNIESLCDTRQEVVEEIRTTVLHEVGHHFGLDEDDLDDLGYA